MKLLSLFVLALVPLVPAHRLGGDEAKQPAAPGVLSKVAVLGASVSAGFGLDANADPFAGQESKLRLATIVSASIVGAHEEPLDLAAMTFFMSPKQSATNSAKSAADSKPTLVVALDYLFWLVYGREKPDPRAERLEAGLKALEVFTCPVLLGDLPDFNGVKVSPLMLAPQAIPPSDVIETFEQRVREWTKGHSNVVLVPVRDMLKKLNADEPIDVRGNHFEKGSRARLVQEDGLHSTLEGTSALWVFALDSWLTSKPAGVDESAFVLKVADLVPKAQALAAKADAGKTKPATKPAKAKEKVGAGSGG